MINSLFMLPTNVALLLAGVGFLVFGIALHVTRGGFWGAASAFAMGTGLLVALGMPRLNISISEFVTAWAFAGMLPGIVVLLVGAHRAIRNSREPALINYALSLNTALVVLAIIGVLWYTGSAGLGLRSEAIPCIAITIGACWLSGLASALIQSIHMPKEWLLA